MVDEAPDHAIVDTFGDTVLFVSFFSFRIMRDKNGRYGMQFTLLPEGPDSPASRVLKILDLLSILRLVQCLLQPQCTRC